MERNKQNIELVDLSQPEEEDMKNKIEAHITCLKTAYMNKQKRAVYLRNYQMESKNPYVNMDAIEQYECNVNKLVVFNMEGFILEDNLNLLNLNFFENCIVKRLLAIG